MNTKFTKGAQKSTGRSMTTDEALLAAGRELEAILEMLKEYGE